MTRLRAMADNLIVLLLYTSITLTVLSPKPFAADTLLTHHPFTHHPSTRAPAFTRMAHLPSLFFRLRIKFPGESPNPKKRAGTLSFFLAHYTDIRYAYYIMETKNSFAVPAAIIISGIIIAVAVVYSVGKFAGPQTPKKGGGGEEINASLDKMRPVDGTDHIRGNIDAPIKIVEYSDTECPFCKRFHFTMKDVVKAYDGKVAWVYRHFPLAQLHSKAFNESKALECAAKLGGETAFWLYTDKLYDITPSNNQLDPAELPRIAGELKLDRQKFAACLASDEMDKRVNDDLVNALETGGNGTPWSILIGPDGKKYPVSGAQPIEVIKQLVDLVLKEK